jgi:hypothetical protein
MPGHLQEEDLSPLRTVAIDGVFILAHDEVFNLCFGENLLFSLFLRRCALLRGVV